jgi:hypothetical protein
MSAVTKQLEDADCYEGPHGLAKASLGLKSNGMKKKNTIKSGVSDRFASSACTGELENLSEDDEVEENLADPDSQLHPLPESSRLDGVPYLISCSIAWYKDKIRLAKSPRGKGQLSDHTRKVYIGHFVKIMTAPSTVNYYGGWAEMFPERIPVNKVDNANVKTQFIETVVRPALEDDGNSYEDFEKTLKDHGAPFWMLYKMFPLHSTVNKATPEDFGYLSIDGASGSGSNAAVSMAIYDDSDPDY